MTTQWSDPPNGTSTTVLYRRAAEAMNVQYEEPPSSSSFMKSHRLRPNPFHGSHRVVAHPMDPIPSSVSPSQPHPDSPAQQQHPTLYDTSVSSATLTNSATEDGRSTGSGSGGKQMYRLRQRPHHPLPYESNTPLKLNSAQTHRSSSSNHRYDNNSNNYNNNNNNQNNSNSHEEMIEPSDPTYVTQSEPGVSVEQDRFAAYINRFAALDPRMDHRRRHSVVVMEEKKVDDHARIPTLSTEQSPPPSVDRIQQKNRFRTRSGYPHSNDVTPHSTAVVVRTCHSQEDHSQPASSTVRRSLRNHPTDDEAMSDIVGINHSPSSRTRDLARRIELHMGRKQQVLQQQREAIRVDDDCYDTVQNTIVSLEEPAPNHTTRTASTRNTNPSATKPITQPHFYYPQHQLGATYVPIPKPQQQQQQHTMEPTTEYFQPVVEDEPIYHHPRYEKRTSSHKVSPQPPDHSTSRRMDVSNAPSYPQRIPERRPVEDIPAVTSSNSNNSIRSKQTMRQRQQQVLRQHEQSTPDIQRQSRGRTNDMYDPSIQRNIQIPQQRNVDVQNQLQVTQQRASRRQEQSQQQPQSRSRSLGPPQRRRQPSVRESPPIQQYSSPNQHTVNNEVDAPKLEAGSSNNGPLIRSLGNRAEIETPLPANVRELRRMLWTEDELLQVKVRSSYRDIENTGGHDYGHTTHMGGPEMAGTAGQRNARSLSPKTHRLRNNNSNDDDGTSHRQYGASAREQKGMLFKSRYYEAALRGDMSTSPKRGMAMAAAETDMYNDRIAPPTKSFDSAAPIKLQKSSSPSDIRSGSTEDIDTTLAIQQDMTNSSSSRQATVNMRNMEHRNQLKATDASMKEDYAMYLLRKINQVNKDDPQAALAEINALLRQQQSTTEVPTESSPNQHMDDPVTREIASVPGVEHAHPMEGDNESDDESDATSVSSMTNPTFVELGHKDSVPISPSDGRPRPSRLGSYNNASPRNISTTNSSSRTNIENRPQPSVKEDQKMATVAVIPTSNDVVDARDTGAQASENKDRTKYKAPNVAVDNKKPNDVVEKKSTPSLLSQLGSLIAPRRLEDLTMQSKEISEKIKQWDELSTGALPVDTSTPSKMPNASLDTKAFAIKAEPKSKSKVSERRDLSPGSALKRDHPWDAAIPVRMGQINTKDTSMDCGDGIEAEFTPKYSKAPISSRINNVAPTARKQQHDVPAQQATSVNKDTVQKKEAPQFMSSNQHQQTKAMSDDFDSAWVSLPSSAFFGSKQNISQPNRTVAVASNQRSNTPTTIHQDVQAEELLPPDAAHDVEVEYVHNSTRIRSGEVQTIAPEETNHSYAQLKSPKRDVYPRHRKSSTFDDSYEETSNQFVMNTTKSFETAPATGDETKPRGRGLRGFLKRKQAEKEQTGSSIDRTSASVVSRRSAATTTAATRPLGELADIEASPSNGNYSELVNRYTRRSAKSRSPSRNRSRSVDERRATRTPSLARKFNRLLRVYDHDNTELTEV